MSDFKADWEDVEHLCSQIIERYKDDDTVKQIVGLSRGGLIPGVIISHALKVPFIPLMWSTRDHGYTDVSKLIQLSRDNRNTLFIDDICDSGETIRGIQRLVHLPRFTTLMVKKKNLVEYSPMEMFDDKRWIVFPWENN